MTVTRSDLPRLGASLGVLGTLLEMEGQDAWDKFAGWTEGPRSAPAAAGDEVCRCGHSVETHDPRIGICLYVGEVAGEQWTCSCVLFGAAPQGSGVEDRKTEAKQRARAAEHFAENRADLEQLDRLVQRITRRHDVAFPPNLSRIQNRRARENAPMTPAEAAIEGFCASCWRNEGHRKEIDRDKNDLKFYRDYCRWCGSMKAEYGIEPPLDMLKLHHDDKRITPEVFAAAVEKITAKTNKQSKGKKKKQRKGWVAA